MCNPPNRKTCGHLRAALDQVRLQFSGVTKFHDHRTAKSGLSKREQICLTAQFLLPSCLEHHGFSEVNLPPLSPQNGLRIYSSSSIECKLTVDAHPGQCIFVLPKALCFHSSVFYFLTLHFGKSNNSHRFPSRIT